MTSYFNALREKGIKVEPKDTLWIEIFVQYVLDKNLISHRVLNLALNKILEMLHEGQTSKDVIDLLKKFDIDYTQINETYLKELKEYTEMFNEK